MGTRHGRIPASQLAAGGECGINGGPYSWFLRQRGQRRPWAISISTFRSGGDSEQRVVDQPNYLGQRLRQKRDRLEQGLVTP